MYFLILRLILNKKLQCIPMYPMILRLILNKKFFIILLTNFKKCAKINLVMGEDLMYEFCFFKKI